MATKAKKRVHPMPKLGWKDQLLYWSAMVLTGGFSLLSFFIVDAIQDRIGFSDSHVIARTVGEGNLNYFWMILWCLCVFCIIIIDPYPRRIPILGRKDIKYGPPAYPHIYPIFMKNKPWHWVSAKALRRKKRLRLLVAILFVCTFLICAAMLPLSFYGRAVLCDDGTVMVYNAYNQEVCQHSINEIATIQLDTDHSSGRSSHSWYIEFEITTTDLKSYSFSAFSFKGTDLQQLQTMLYVKEQLYGDRCDVSGIENIQKVVRDQYQNEEERNLLYQLFEITP